MKKTPIIKVSKEADEGLIKFKKDISSIYNWGKKQYKKYSMGSDKRPKGIPKTKKFDGHKYNFFGIFKDRDGAKELAYEIRDNGSYARIQKYKGSWIVWEGGKYS